MRTSSLKAHLVGLLLVCLGQPVFAADLPATAPATYANVAYGTHERNVLDFWQAPGKGPRPLLVYIHGGGWTSGDKSVGGPVPSDWLSRGVSYAAVNYRYSTIAPLPAPVHDAARAIQFLRSKADSWQIDKDRICVTGGSAGACTSMWLLCHDDLANPKSTDPVERESTRVAGAATRSGQVSLDPRQIEPWLGKGVLEHRMVNLSVGEPTIAGALANYERHRATYIEFAPYTHVSADDPPLFMLYGDDETLPSKNGGHGIHHPVYGRKMKEKADQVGMPCHLVIGKFDPKLSKYATADEFLQAVLLGERPTPSRQ